MIHPLIPAVAYLLVAVMVVGLARGDYLSLFAARLFLAAIMVSWTIFYTVVWWQGLAPPDLQRTARVLHVSTAVGIGMMIWARWSLHKRNRS